jgi:G3E family GTPase
MPPPPPPPSLWLSSFGSRNPKHSNQHHHHHHHHHHHTPSHTPKPKQLRHVLTNIGEKLSPQEMDALVAEADTKGDGRVEREAFVRLLMAK